MAAASYSSTHPLAEAAYGYAAAGMAVFPLVPRSKSPLLSKAEGGQGWKDATTDLEQVRAWWTRWPTANIGYAPRGQHLIIDIDLRHQGKEAWVQLNQLIPMPETRRVKTGNGYHLYFTLPEGLSLPSCDVPGSTLEIKCETGYLLLPPSIHPDGPLYTWMNPDAPLAPVPDALIALLLPKKEPTSQEWKQDRHEGSVIDAFNARYTIYEQLERHGYLRAGNERYKRPGGHSASVVILEGARSYHHSSSDALHSNQTHDAFSISCHFDYAGDVKAAVKAAAALLGMKQSPRSSPSSAFDAPTSTFPLEMEVLNTDAGNARRLVGLFGQDIRYCPEWKCWLVWNGRFWERDASDLRLMQMAKRTVQSLYQEAQGWVKKLADERPPELIGEEAEKYNHFVRKATALLSWAQKSEDSRRLHAMILLARSEPDVPLSAEQLDQDKYLLNVQNGTIELHTCHIRSPRREDYITKAAPMTYDPQAQCPTWLAFLDRIMASDQDKLHFLQQAAGYALTGSTQEQVFYLLYGTGANGKSTFLETLQEALGEYALQVAPETLLVKKNEGIPNDLARLRGARLVAAIETEDGKRLAEARVKQLTGGDKVSARFLFAEWFDFRPEFKLFLATNHKPNVRGTDHAIWRRVRFIPFTVTIPDDERDGALPEKLRMEFSGILNWLLAGCIDWQQNGHQPPESVRAATQAYQHEQDTLQTFLDDECVTTPHAKVAVAQFYRTYKAWAEENHEALPSQRKLGEAMIEKGFTRIREWLAGKQQWIWEGVGFPTDHPDDNQPGTRRNVPNAEKVTSSPATPGDIWAEDDNAARRLDVTDVKINYYKKVTPHIGDFPDFTSVTSRKQTVNIGSDQAETGLLSLDVTLENPEVTSRSSEVTSSKPALQEEPPSAKMRAQQKQWPVDPPSAQQRRIQTLLECLSERQRSWNVCQEAAHAYVAADEPPYTINFWGHGPQPHKNKPLWTQIGQALDSGGTAESAAIEVLDQMRARTP